MQQQVLTAQLSNPLPSLPKLVRPIDRRKTQRTKLTRLSDREVEELCHAYPTDASVVHLAKNYDIHRPRSMLICSDQVSPFSPSGRWQSKTSTLQPIATGTESQVRRLPRIFRWSRRQSELCWVDTEWCFGDGATGTTC